MDTSDTALIQELLSANKGKTSEEIGVLVGVSQQQVSKWKTTLKQGKPIQIHESTRERVKEVLERLRLVSDYDRGWRDALEWVQSEIQRRAAIIAAAPTASAPRPSAREVKNRLKHRPPPRDMASNGDPGT